VKVKIKNSPKEISQIRDTSDLPRWFDLKKYEDLNGFGIEDWYLSLRFRFELLEDIIRSLPVVSGFPSIEKHLIAEDLRNRRITKEEAGLARRSLGEKIDSIGDRFESIKCNPLGCTSKYDRSALKYGFSSIAVRKVDSPRIPPLDHEKMLLEVNIRASDLLIFEQIKMVLDKERTKAEVGKLARLTKQKALINHQILPYLDLHLWAIVEGKDIFNIKQEQPIWPQKLLEEILIERKEKLEKSLDFIIRQTPRKRLYVEAGSRKLSEIDYIDKVLRAITNKKNFISEKLLLRKLFEKSKVNLLREFKEIRKIIEDLFLRGDYIDLAVYTSQEHDRICKRIDRRTQIMKLKKERNGDERIQKFIDKLEKLDECEQMAEEYHQKNSGLLFGQFFRLRRITRAKRMVLIQK
jgi:hypothetical protein